MPVGGSIQRLPHQRQQERPCRHRRVQVLLRLPLQLASVGCQQEEPGDDDHRLHGRSGSGRPHIKRNLDKTSPRYFLQIFKFIKISTIHLVFAPIMRMRDFERSLI